jgi:ATP citrate (pro-S)-lyase
VGDRHLLKAFKTECTSHAGAKAGSESETADAKNAALKTAGAVAPNSFDDYGEKIAKVYNDLVKKKIIIPRPEPAAVKIPMDYNTAIKAKMVRKPANFISTISDDRGEELLYGTMPISEVFSKDIGIGGVLSILWFKRRLPVMRRSSSNGNHGDSPSWTWVSGAHNTIVG